MKTIISSVTRPFLLLLSSLALCLLLLVVSYAFVLDLDLVLVLALALNDCDAGHGVVLRSCLVLSVCSSSQIVVSRLSLLSLILARVLSCLVVLSCLCLSCLASSCLVLFCFLVLSCFILSGLVLIYLVSLFRKTFCAKAMLQSKFGPSEGLSCFHPVLCCQCIVFWYVVNMFFLVWSKVCYSCFLSFLALFCLALCCAALFHITL
jgi:hypothetical protein